MALNEVGPGGGTPLPMRPAAELISYTDLYARWEASNWSATSIDFTEDARQWREELTDFERRAALWNYALFFWGEDAVADALSPYVEAAPTEEQRYALTTQQVDEARHAVFFRRFMHEVCGVGAGDAASGLRAIEPQLTWGFRQVFDRLDRMADELRKDPSTPRFCAAVTLYHFIVEATLAQPGQHFITSYLEERQILPGFREGMENVARDEQRHIALGVRLLYDLARPDERCRRAVADLLREVVPWTAAVLMPPGGDRRYTEVFGATIEDVGEEGALSLETKLRAAGLPLDELPGPPVFPAGLTAREQSDRGTRLVEIGMLGPKTGPPSRDPEDVALIFDTMRRRVGADHGLPHGTTIGFDLHDLEPWRLVLDGDGARAERGPVDRADVRIRLRYEDLVDLAGSRVTAPRLVATRRLRLRGRPRVLLALPRVLGPGG